MQIHKKHIVFLTVYYSTKQITNFLFYNYNSVSFLVASSLCCLLASLFSSFFLCFLEFIELGLSFLKSLLSFLFSFGSSFTSNLLNFLLNFFLVQTFEVFIVETLMCCSHLFSNSSLSWSSFDLNSSKSCFFLLPNWYLGMWGFIHARFSHSETSPKTVRMVLPLEWMNRILTEFQGGCTGKLMVQPFTPLVILSKLKSFGSDSLDSLSELIFLMNT